MAIIVPRDYRPIAYRFIDFATEKRRFEAVDYRFAIFTGDNALLRDASHISPVALLIFRN